MFSSGLDMAEAGDAALIRQLLFPVLFPTISSAKFSMSEMACSRQLNVASHLRTKEIARNSVESYRPSTLASNPQAMQQHLKFSCGRNQALLIERSTFASFAVLTIHLG